MGLVTNSYVINQGFALVVMVKDIWGRKMTDQLDELEKKLDNLSIYHSRSAASTAALFAYYRALVEVIKEMRFGLEEILSGDMRPTDARNVIELADEKIQELLK